MSLQLNDRSGPILEVVKLLQEGLWSLYLLPPEHPEHLKVLDQIRVAFGPVWSLGPSLTLSLTPDAVEWEGEAVLISADNPSGFGLQLVEGGLKDLVFTPGVEAEEVGRFLEVLHRAGTLVPDDEDDLKTLLWREDFDHLHYTAVEAPTGEAPPPLAPEPKEPVAPTGTIGEKVREDAAVGDRASAVVKLEEFDSTLYFLDQLEIDYLRDGIEAEYAQDHARNVVALLLDTFELQPNPECRNEVIEVLESLLPLLLGSRNFRVAAFLISEVRSLLNGGLKMDPPHKAALDTLSMRLSEPEVLAQLFHVLQDAETLPSDEELKSLLSYLRPEALGTLLLWLRRLTRQDARDVLTTTVREIMQKNPRALSMALGSSDSVVVLRALELGKRFKIEIETEFLVGLKSHTDLSIRAALVPVLASIRSAGAFRILTDMLDDPIVDVRIGILQALTNRPYQGALARLEEMIQSKDLEERDLSEKRALFEAYGLIAGPSGTTYLGGVLRGKAGFGRQRPSSDTRACAAVALGKVSTPDARRILEKALRERDPVVRNAAKRALGRDSG
jgi:hypothetical protein